MKSPFTSIAEAIERVVDYKLGRIGSPEQTVPATYLGTDGQGKAFVRLAGSDSATPVKSMAVQADVGDTVRATIGNGRIVVSSNVSNPSASASNMGRVEEQAFVAKETAAQAVNYASEAMTASSAAKTSASSAMTSALRAQQSADSAQADAERAHEAADSAVEDARIAFEAAVSAQEDANRAYTSSLTANNAANSALTQLSTVQDVVGVLDWAQKNATFEPTADVEIVVGKVYWKQVYGYVVSTDTVTDLSKAYYTVSGGGTEENPYIYTQVQNPAPDANPSELGWYEHEITGYEPVPNPVQEELPSYYEISAAEAMADYVSSHLALTDEGLYVVKDGEGYKVLLSNTGMLVQDTIGTTVATFGENIELSSTRPQRIGGENAYIVYYDSDSDNVPDSIDIGGSNVNINIGDSRSLASVLDELDATSTGLQGQADALAKEIDDRESQYGDLSSAITSVNVNVNGLVTQISNVSDDLGAVTNRVIIGQAQDPDDPSVELPAITLDATGGVELQPGETSFKAVLTNKSLSFVENGQDVAWISNRELHITSATVTDTLRFGGFAFIPRSNGNLALKWLGGE